MTIDENEPHIDSISTDLPKEINDQSKPVPLNSVPYSHVFKDLNKLFEKADQEMFNQSINKAPV